MERASLHTHTQWSDGLVSVEELVRGATQQQFAMLGISDHLILHPEVAVPDVTMPLDRIDAYVHDVLCAREKAAIPVKLGVEVDFFPANPYHSRIMDILNGYPFDYVIGSIHMIHTFPIDRDPSYWRPLSQERIDHIYEAYWRAMKELAETGFCHIVGHLDLPKKFGFQPRKDLTRLVNDALEAIRKAGVVVELNTGGWDKQCRECYPSPELISKCAERGIPMMVNDDAHHSDQLARYFERAQHVLKDAGIHPREASSIAP